MEDRLSAHSLHRLLRRAALCVRAALRGEAAPGPPTAPEPSLEGPGGVFVTLRKGGHLAGCIGYVQSDAPLWETTAAAARGAALDDPRFEPLDPDDPDGVDVEVSVLSPPWPIRPEEIEVGRHGLILDRPPWRGLLLPQVAVEHDLDREAFLRALARKAGLAEGAWKDPEARLQAFTVQKAEGSWATLCAEEEKT